MRRLLLPSLSLLLLLGCSPAEPASDGAAAVEALSTNVSPATASAEAHPVVAPLPQSEAGDGFVHDASTSAGSASAPEETSVAKPAAPQTQETDAEEPATEVSTDASSTSEWRSLLDSVDPARDGIAGSWRKTDEGLRVAAATGARLAIPGDVPAEYDVRIAATRHTGQHSLALLFPHGSGQASFEVDAWGRHLGGIQNVGGRSIQENATRKEGVALENGHRYVLTVEVRRSAVRAYLDDQLIAEHAGDGGELSVPDLWRMPDRARLGIGAWESETTFHAVELRAVGGDSIASVAPAAGVAPAPAASSVAATAPTISPTELSVETPSAEEPATPSPPATPPPAGGPAGKRVLIVIANYDFFYREYGDPRQELERAGVAVTVAAGRKDRCTPHGGSGQGADGGVVTADIAIRDAKADDYDAILFSGGWGASAYQYAFEGRYDKRQYNGDRETKAAVNRLIGDFLEQDKYVAALCNGVTILAWARIDGESPLAGKRVCAPTRQAASGIYDGRPAQPSCRWHPERNGAILSPAGAIGQPGTAADDVLVDGLIATGEDDISAREMGRTLVRLLSERK